MKEVHDLRNYIRNLKKSDALRHKQIYSSMLSHSIETPANPRPLRYSVIQRSSPSQKRPYYTPKLSSKQKWAEYIENYAAPSSRLNEDYYEKVRRKNTQRLKKLSSAERAAGYYDRVDDFIKNDQRSMGDVENLVNIN